MRHFIPYLALPLALATACWLAGCNGGTPTVEKNGEEGHAHEHDHDHPASGPHGGHLIELGEEEYHAEWTHDDKSGKVTIYILDGAAKKEVPIAAEQVTIVTRDPKGEQIFDLPAVDRTTGDMPTAFQFEVENKELLGVLETLSDDVTATLKVDVNGKPFEGKITHGHDHDHGHKH